MLRSALAIIGALALIFPATAQEPGLGESAYWRGDFDVALHELRPRAEQGDPAAQKTLGLMYFGGEGVNRSAGSAAKWYRMAAEQGDAGAQSMLGAMYEYGLGVTKNSADATRWYRRAAAQGGAESRLSKIMWWRLAAARGDVSAQHRLGNLYAKGEGVPQSFVLAYMWSSLAAKEGNRKSALRRDYIAMLMTPDDIEAAQRKAQNWESNSAR